MPALTEKIVPCMFRIMTGYGLLTPTAACPTTIRLVSASIEYRWRGPVSDAEMMTLITARGSQAVPGWWDQIRPCGLGWVTARVPGGGLVGFVNVAWDGGDHAFLLDTKVARDHQRQGTATVLAGHAARHAGRPGASGCTSTSGRTWQRSTLMPAASRARQPE